MRNPTPEELLRKHQLGTLTANEKILLESWYEDYARKQQELPASNEDLPQRLQEVWSRLSDDEGEEEMGHEPQPYRIPWRWIGIAASVLLILGLRYVMVKETDLTQTTSRHEPVKGLDVPPGVSRAYLTLSNGKTIDLGKDQSGLLANESSVEVVKSIDGELYYRKSAKQQIDRGTIGKVYHMVTTPRAGEYRIRLEDGTQVWLNAGSSLRFPPVFSEKERLVELDGEAYFDVSHIEHNGKKVPFSVQTGLQTIEVLGTQFNVKNYKEEHFIKTTLVEGSIKVRFSSLSNKAVLLKPGQQLRYGREHSKRNGTELISVDAIDAGVEVAWKNGYFNFDNVSLEELMNQISRWYNMEVVYEGDFDTHKFVGRIERTASLIDVLSILEVGDLSFRIEQNKIFVYKSD